MSRIFGGRDLALGVVLLQALREERPEAVNRALLLGAGCDAWDAVAALRSPRASASGAVLVVATLGSTFAVLGASAAFAPPVDASEFASAAPSRARCRESTPGRVGDDARPGAGQSTRP